MSNTDLSPEKLLENKRTEFLKEYAALCEKHGLEIAFQPILRSVVKQESQE
jgi:hypothetical protein